jgi:hypothetical protein
MENHATLVHEQHHVQNSLKVFPVPAQDRVTIQLNIIPQESYNLHVYNLQGHAVKVISGLHGSEQVIDKGSLPPGMYIFYLIKRQHILGSGKFVFL